MSTTVPVRISDRGRALLRAIAQGRAEITLSCEPDLRVDGLLCCDQFCAHELTRSGLLRPVRPGRPGDWVRAVLTDAGRSLLDRPHRDAA